MDTIRTAALAALAMALCACGKSPVSPSASPRFLAVGDLELMRCNVDACDRFAFLLRNVGDVCVVTLNFSGTVTLTESSGATSTANWELEDPRDRLFQPGETRRMVQRNGVLRNPPGPHTYSVSVTYAVVPGTCD